MSFKVWEQGEVLKQRRFFARLVEKFMLPLIMNLTIVKTFVLPGLREHVKV